MKILSEGWSHAPAVSQPTPPLDMSVTAQAQRALTAGARWIAAGVPIVDDMTLAARLEACRGCDLWDLAAFGGTGKCKVCGCSRLKLSLATEKCPHPNGSRWPVDKAS